MHKLLKFLLAPFLPAFIVEGGGGGSDLSTNSFAEMMSGGSDDNGQPDTDPQNVDPDQDPDQDPDPDAVAPDVDPDADPDAPDPDGHPDTPDPDEAFLELEINGENVKVSKDEAKNGYLRQQDYTQKAQNLARERQESQAHIQQQFAQVQQFSQEIGTLTNLDATLNQYQNVDWAALRESDPVSYAAHQADYNNLRIQRGDMVNAITSKQQQFAAMQQQQFLQQTQEAQTYLTAKIPGFGKEHLTQMKEFGVAHGFQPEELANVSDKRMLEVLWKASQYDKTQATTQKAVKAVAALPTKANKPAPASKPANEINIDKQVKRVQQSGSLKDFGALLGMTKR